MADFLETVFALRDEVTDKFKTIVKGADRVSDAFEEAADSGSEFEGSISRMASVFGSVAASIFSINKAIDGFKALTVFSDDITLINSRLKMATDGTMTLAGAQELVMQKANETGSTYQNLAGIVGGLGTLANDAFSGTKEVVDFASTLQQAFVVGGAGTAEMEGATRQLTQALASGVLRGDELNSVMENAPVIVEALAKQLGVTKGEIRDLAADGKLDAKTVKDAVLAYSDEIQSKFNEMGGTLSGTIGNRFKNGMAAAFGGASSALNELFNSESFARFLDAILAGARIFGGVLTVAIKGAGAAMDFFAKHSALAKAGLLILGLVAGFVFARIIHGVTRLIVVYGILHGVSVKTAMGHLIAWGAAHWPFLVVIGVIGTLVGVLAWLGVSAEDVAGVAIGAFNAMKAAGFNMVLMLAQAFSFFVNHQLEKLKLLLGFAESVASTVSGKKVRFEAAHKVIDSGDHLVSKIMGMKYQNTEDAYEAGKSKGKELYKSLSGKFKGFAMPGINNPGNAEYGGLSNAANVADSLSSVKDSSERTANNTEDIKSSLASAVENLAFLTDASLMQRTVIFNNNNRLEVANHFNNPDASFDIDGLGESLGLSFLEAISSGAGGGPALELG